MITRIAIKNFKSLDVDFTLDPVTVLVGKSGTGKSNVIDAMRYLRDALHTGNLGSDFSILSATSAPKDEMRFQVWFEVDGIHGQYCYLLVLPYVRGSGVQFYRSEEKLSLGDRVFFHVVDQTTWKVEPLLKELIDPNDLVLRRLAGIQEVSVASVALTEGLGCYDFPGDVCTPTNHAKSSANGLHDAGGNCAAVFTAIQNNLSRLKDWKEINGALKLLNVTLNTVDTKDQQIKVSHTLPDGLLTLDIALESEGFRRFFAHLVALYQQPPKQTLFFEEPEKGIHPGALATLAEEIDHCPLQGRGQVVLTTHSPNLLDHFEPENLRVVEMENGVTRIGAIEQAQLEAVKEGLMETGGLLTADPARLQPV